MGIVPVVGRELNVCGGDGDTTLAFLGGFVNGGVLGEVRKVLGGLLLSDSGSQCCLDETYKSATRIRGRDRNTFP